MGLEQNLSVRVPSFEDIEAVKAAQLAKRDNGRVNLYPRDGSAEVFQLEDDIADMLRVRRGNLLLYGTGMSALLDALEIGRLTVGTRILRGTQHYNQAADYVSEDLGSRGVLVYKVDSDDLNAIDASLRKNRPDAIVFETIVNGSEMFVLNLEGFLSLPILTELDPLIVLDNTLPSSTGLPLGEIMTDTKRRIIGVESGTKYIALNTEMCGLTYTYDQDLLTKLKKRRQRTGSLLSISAAETIAEVIRKAFPEGIRDYDRRNLAIFSNTLRLARACYAAEEESDWFATVHPNLPNHVNAEYSNNRFPDGASPVFFIQPTSMNNEDHYRIAEKLRHHPVIRSLCDLGQSFGFDRTRIWPDDNSPALRISGGIYAQKEQAELERAFYEALL